MVSNSIKRVSDSTTSYQKVCWGYLGCLCKGGGGVGQILHLSRLTSSFRTLPKATTSRKPMAYDIQDKCWMRREGYFLLLALWLAHP